MSAKDLVLEGSRLRIRPTRAEAELGFVMALEHAEENRSFISPWERRQHEAFRSDPDHLHMVIETREANELVGYLLLKGVTLAEDCVDITRLVIASKGNGFGREALRLVKRWAFDEAGAHRLQLDVKSKNLRAQALYKSEGFVQEGVLRECLRDESESGYESLYLMSILEKEYRDV